MGIKLVIADDAAFIREVVRQIFSETDVTVVGEATNGEEAVQLVLDKQPQVVLMDIVMPKMSGIEATKQILEKRPSTKVVACTTEGQKSMVLKALNAGCADYIAKPFKKDQLINTVESVIHKK